MRRSEQRILTTHTGSLPRPLELTKLYAKRARGEPVDAAMLQAAGRAALRVIVPKQVDAGIDIGNNGEQQRDSFIFCIRDRLSGLGGSWQRRQRADVERYPIFMKESYEASLKKESVDDIRGLPKAVGDIAYPDAADVTAGREDTGRRQGRTREFASGDPSCSADAAPRPVRFPVPRRTPRARRRRYARERAPETCRGPRSRERFPVSGRGCAPRTPTGGRVPRARATAASEDAARPPQSPGERPGRHQAALVRACPEGRA